MHIFLTGDVQIGKSTIIQTVASHLALPLGGFISSFGQHRDSTDRWLYLNPAGVPPRYDEAHGVVRYRERKGEVLTHRFDALGCAFLHSAWENHAQLILMDECGRFEGEALAFQSEIFRTLNGQTPVLGVVRQGYAGWLDQIRSHPNVTLMTVTQENRDSLPWQIIQMLI